MSSLSYLLGYLDAGSFDCIEFGDAVAPGRVDGALRLRPAEQLGTYQVSQLTTKGNEEFFPGTFNSQTVETALQRFTVPIARSNPSRFVRFFGISFNGSRR